ncbi:MAG: ferrochelatase [Acidimicrobiia bacterium]
MNSNRDLGSARTGVLLIQVGTPASPETRDVRRYLREFLSDPRVLDMPRAARFLLLNAVILPFRPKKSAAAYRKIWTDEGSPLAVHTTALAEQVQQRLGDGFRVEAAMRYQQPSLASQIDALINDGCTQLVLVPMYPQNASASTGTSLAKAMQLIGDRFNVVPISTVPAFFEDAGFLDAQAEIARPLIAEFKPDHVLFSYHGLPEKQVKQSELSAAHCLERADCCAAMTPANHFCYRAQSFATTRGLAARLGLAQGAHSTSFQSRLKGQAWIKPHTDLVLPELAAAGVRRLAVLTPSFVADCLETIEEIGMRAAEQWTELGGDALVRVPCVNSSPAWADAVAALVRTAN